MEDLSLLLFEVTEKAAQQIRTLVPAGDEDKAVRVYLDGLTENGLAWGMAIDEANEGDEAVSIDGLTIVIEKALLAALGGIVVDFLTDELGGGFMIVPQAPGLADFDAGCGCGCGCGSCHGCHGCHEDGCGSCHDFGCGKDDCDDDCCGCGHHGE